MCIVAAQKRSLQPAPQTVRWSQVSDAPRRRPLVPLFVRLCSGERPAECLHCRKHSRLSAPAARAAQLPRALAAEPVLRAAAHAADARAADAHLLVDLGREAVRHVMPGHAGRRM